MSGKFLLFGLVIVLFSSLLISGSPIGGPPRVEEDQLDNSLLYNEKAFDMEDLKYRDGPEMSEWIQIPVSMLGLGRRPSYAYKSYPFAAGTNSESQSRQLAPSEYFPVLRKKSLLGIELADFVTGNKGGENGGQMGSGNPRLKQKLFKSG